MKLPIEKSAASSRPLNAWRVEKVDKFMKACLIASLVFMLGLAGAGTYEFGSKVALGNTDVGNLLYNTAPSFMYWDISPVGYGKEDIVYLHLSGTSCETCGLDAAVSTDDIRITPNGGLAAGTKVDKGDNDTNMPLIAFPSCKIKFLDLDGNPGYNFQDPVYLSIAGGTTIETNDIRLNNIDGLHAGTKVNDFNPDHGKNSLIDMPPYSIRFFNANGNYALTGVPIYDSADSVYLDLSMPPANPIGFVAVNDVRLSV